jgi:hypothetical protein
MYLQSLDRDPEDYEMISRIKRETELKEEFLRRPVSHLFDKRRASYDALPPVPTTQLQQRLMQQQQQVTVKERSSVGKDLNGERERVNCVYSSFGQRTRWENIFLFMISM